jgi:phosphomannomutase
MDEPIISVSGLRGVVGTSLTPELALRYAAAFAGELESGPVVVTRDGRDSGPMLASAVIAGLSAVGRDTWDLGVAATPTTGILVRDLKAAGGIQISASHNPSEYNGLKLFSSQGRVIPAAVGQRVTERFRRATPAWVPHYLVGQPNHHDDAVSGHVKRVLAIVDSERIRLQRFKVVLDANHGAGSLVGQALLEEFGCRITILGGRPDGRFEHDPEPLAENLADVLPRVAGADVGFCQDPDADRLAVIDENGRYLGEEYTLALCADHILRHRPGPIVTNCSTSRMTECLAKKYKVPFYYSKVGEANVVDSMVDIIHHAIFGGEGNGGVIDPRVGLVRDSFAGMALILDAMAARGKPISELADELPRFYIVKTKIGLLPSRMTAGLAALEKHFAAARPSRMDGLRLDWQSSWLLVRASNTEPVVRAIAEAETETEARHLCEEAASVLARLSAG